MPSINYIEIKHGIEVIEARIQWNDETNHEFEGLKDANS